MTESVGGQEAFDVVVIGAGTAGLCAALAASEAGRKVLVLEAAPEETRGGNTTFSDGVFRFSYRGEEEIAALVPDEDLSTSDVGEYPAQAFVDDLMRLSEEMIDPGLARLLVKSSYPTVQWLGQQGARWTLAHGRWSMEIDGVQKFWTPGMVCEIVGGGAGLVEQLSDLAVERGVQIRYRHRALALRFDADGQIGGVDIRTPDGMTSAGAPAVVLAAGGYEANAEMRARYLGPEWDLVKVRGTRFNVGDGLRMALDAGAEPFGHWSSCHSVALDIGAGDYGRHEDANNLARHSYPFGIVVNAEARRFLDEGADLRSYTYSKYGREILKQPRRVAFQIFDQQVDHLLREQYRARGTTFVTADTIEELAEELLLDPQALAATVEEFNRSCGTEEFDPSRKDGRATHGLEPPKSNWALPLEKPPYVAYPVTTGITYTFGGLRIDSSGAVMGTDGSPIGGLFAAGELVGGIFYGTVPTGSALMAAAAFGRIAGAGSAAFSQNRQSDV